MAKYYDVDGNEVSLHRLCELDPGWASSRIGAMTAEIEQLRKIAAAASVARRHGWGAIDMDGLSCQDHFDAAVKLLQTKGNDNAN
jgi:hypothetical protein